MMKMLQYCTLSCLTIFALSFFAQPVAHAADEGDQGSPTVIAVVNGNELTRAGFSLFVNMRLGQRGQAEQLDQRQLNALLAEYINRELIYQDASARGWDNAPEVKAAVDNQRRNIVASYAVRRLISATPSEAMMKQAYSQMKGKPTKEYKTRHILVKTENEANDVIDALKNGAAFASLAQEHSVDSSAREGGSLGWLSPEQLVEPLRETLLGLETGSYSRSPVESQFGWHVVKLDDTRIIPPPPFESVKDQVRKRLQNQQVTNYISQLRKNSHIEIK